ASRTLLREIAGINATSATSVASMVGLQQWNGGGRINGSDYDPQDWGRKFLPTSGSSAYIDLDHCEVCIPEVLSAYDHVAAWHAMLRIVRAAQASANGRLRDGQRLHVLVNNSDGKSHSYGSHLNVMMSRVAWNRLFHRHLHYLEFLVAFQASAIILTGQGKVGAENHAPPVPYQIAQRADFIETICGEQTTYRRPIVNARDESLAGKSRDLARLHCIFFDSALAHGSCLLRIGPLQIVLAMIEAGAVNPRLALDDPVEAVQRWSHDPTLKARARMLHGSPLTAIELQFLFVDAAERFVADGRCDGIVPRAVDIVAFWRQTLSWLEARNVDALARRLDWVLKQRTIERVLDAQPRLSWTSPEIKVVDLLYSSLDADEGLYWQLDTAGAVEHVVPEARVAELMESPPPDTRAWTRAQLLRRLPAESIDSIDWDGLVVRRGWRNGVPLYRRIDLGDPLAGTRPENEETFRRCHDLDALLDALGASPAAPRQRSAWTNAAYA
ncbi:MAG TPA: proteasome accessory factor PafA2 family protein, partial [Candidatus Acidoferrales bacterium]|nr:proteasome accessory factor PafA2 family protein [Candidatus Acidoferrales bacterium]